jgi:hypothetical protein
VKTPDPNTIDDDDLAPLSPEEEEALREEIELALEPYRKLTPELIPTLREELERALRTHPYPRQLLRAFAPRKPVAASGESPVDSSRESQAKAGGKGGA